MRSGRGSLSRYALLLLLLLAPALTGCPFLSSQAPGYISLYVDATNTDRCSDGIKAELVGVQEGWLKPGDPLPEDEAIYGAGNYWVWVKKGHEFLVEWRTLDGLNNSPEGKLIVVRAYCMRGEGVGPGVSEKTYHAGSFRTPGGVVDILITVIDTGPIAA